VLYILSCSFMSRGRDRSPWKQKLVITGRVCRGFYSCCPGNIKLIIKSLENIYYQDVRALQAQTLLICFFHLTFLFLLQRLLEQVKDQKLQRASSGSTSSSAFDLLRRSVLSFLHETFRDRLAIPPTRMPFAEIKFFDGVSAIREEGMQLIWLRNIKILS
jgi:hypothetical protein